MHPRLADDLDHLPALIALASAYATAVLEQLDSAPVAVPPRAQAATTLTPAGIGAEEALRRFRETIAPSLSASAGPRHLGFVTGGTTPAALIGDWLAAVFDQNPVSRLDGATALQLERDTVTMLRTLFGLPVAFAGSFVSGATMSNFVGLALAREWAGRTYGIRVSDEGLDACPVSRSWPRHPIQARQRRCRCSAWAGQHGRKSPACPIGRPWTWRRLSGNSSEQPARAW